MISHVIEVKGVPWDSHTTPCSPLVVAKVSMAVTSRSGWSRSWKILPKSSMVWPGCSTRPPAILISHPFFVATTADPGTVMSGLFTQPEPGVKATLSLIWNCSPTWKPLACRTALSSACMPRPKKQSTASTASAPTSERGAKRSLALDAVTARRRAAARPSL